MMMRIAAKVVGVFVVAMVMGGVVSGAEPVSLQWLEKGGPGMEVGVTWGVSWPPGVVKKGDGFVMKGSGGKGMSLQSWPLGYWPDGSVKWEGFATVAGTGSAGYEIAVADGAGAPVVAGSAVKVTEGE